MKTANVVEVFMNDDNPYELSSILVNVKNGSSDHSQLRKAIPLNPTSYTVPVVGEQVYVIRVQSSNSSLGNAGESQYYYINPIASHCNLNINLLPNLHAIGQSGVGGDYNEVSLGVPNISSTLSTKEKLGDGFESNDKVQPIQPFVGDVIQQGRFGQSIRFGYTPNVTNSSNKPSWTSTESSSPITIMRNGGAKSEYNKFTIEDINEDDSSMWLTSKQKVSLKPSNGFSLGVLPIGQYSNPQLILNSDRVVINSKSDSVLISGNKSVNVSTPNWKADMDTMFTQLEEITNSLISLSSKMATITATPPLTPLAAPFAELSTKATQIKTQLTLMKQ